jgi:hypothetical protein
VWKPVAPIKIAANKPKNKGYRIFYDKKAGFIKKIITFAIQN